MATLRPAVEENDSYVQKIVKYIPAEIIAGYTTLVGYLSFGSFPIPAYYEKYYCILLIILSIITPLWTYFAVLDNNDNSKKRAYFHSAIATFAFWIWVYAVGNPLLKALICGGCDDKGCADCIYYSPVFGSIILVLFTIMTPVLERMVLGTKLPK